MGLTVRVREFDGGRRLEMTKVPGFVVLDTGSQAFAIDEAHFMHQIKRLMRVSVILEHADAGGGLAVS